MPFLSLGHLWRAPSYGEERISEEVAYIAYHFHWPLEAILGLEHGERRRWAREIGRINERMNEESAAGAL